MKLVLVLVTAASLWQALTRDTNSRAAGERGARAFEEKKYDLAARSFAAAKAIAPSPRATFNLGTAQVAAGRRSAGSTTLTEAMRDPAVRAESLYNRGNSALAAKAWEHAIRDYSDALRARPADAQAKRNLEIALHQLQAMQQQQSRGNQGRQQQGSSPQPQPPQQPSEGREDPDQKDADSEALLRSVQQQEQEELSRMRKARAGGGRVGW